MGSANDIETAKKTYGGFIAMLKWTVPFIAIIALFILVLIA